MIDPEEFELEEKVIKPTEEKGNKEKKKKLTLWNKIFKKSKLQKPNKIAVIYLRTNGVAEPMEVESRKGFINIHGRTYHEDKDCIYRLGKERYPFAIIPEGNVLPIGRKDWEDKTMQEKFSTLQDHVMKGIRHAERVRMGESETTTKVTAKTAIGIAIAVVIVLAFIWGYVGG